MESGWKEEESEKRKKGAERKCVVKEPVDWEKRRRVAELKKKERHFSAAREKEKR